MICVAATILLAAFAAPGIPASQAARILSLVFEGNRSIPTEVLRSEFRVFREGGWYEPESFAIEVAGLEQHCRNMGFLQAKVTVASVEYRDLQEKGRGVAIRLRVDDGPLYRAARLTVENARALDGATLLQMAPFGTGEPFSRKQVAEWVERMRESYASMGHIRFDAGVSEIVNDAARTVDCTIELREGKAYRIGTITVAGEGAVDALTFKKQILMGEGGLYNPEMLILTIHFLNRLRIYRTVTAADVDVRIDDERGVVDLVFRISPLRRPPVRYNFRW